MSAQRASIHHLGAESSELSKIKGAQVATTETSSFAPAPYSFCYGSGMEVVQGKGARRCRLEQQQLKLLEQSRIPRRYENCALANYRPTPNNGTQLQAFNFAFKLVSEFLAVNRSLLFMGPVGIGKTHLSVAILRELMEKKDVSCLFLEQSRGPLIYALLKYDFLTLYPVNPRTLSKFREAFSPSRHKDDLPDAEHLAELLLHHRERLRA
jgi:DNA replication protein DnaC